MVAGFLLYWAEGSKMEGTMRIANLDARMLQLFARFLREVCHAQERRLRVYPRVSRECDLVAARRYWARLLKLPSDQVHVYPHTDTRSLASRQWSPYGLATLEFHNTKLKRWRNQAIEAYLAQQLGTKVARRNGRRGLSGYIVRDGLGKYTEFTAQRSQLADAGHILCESQPSYEGCWRN